LDWTLSTGCYRKRLRHGPAPDGPHQGGAFPGHRQAFKLISAASRTWRRLQGENQLPKIIQGVKFRDGIEVSVPTSDSAA